MRTILTSILFFICVSAVAGDTLRVSDTKYTVCDFSSEIKYVDFGSPDLQGAVLNHKDMLSLQAVQPLEHETTLSVVTANGKYHAFIVKYDDASVDLSWVENGNAPVADTLSFSTVKTTHLISAEKITDVLCGTPGIIAEHADNISNIVKAKALDEDFAPGSITLVSSSGTIYPFVVIPGDNPRQVDILLSGGMDGAPAIFSDASVNDVQMRDLGRKAAGLPVLITDIGTVKQKMAFALYGLYSHDDVMMFCLSLENNNLIDYEIDFIKCYVRDKKRSKKITVQEDEITPIFVYYPQGENHNLLKGGEKLTAVLFFRRFTIPQKRILCFEVFERNGGRHLQFSMSDKELLKARQLDL